MSHYTNIYYETIFTQKHSVVLRMPKVKNIFNTYLIGYKKDGSRAPEFDGWYYNKELIRVHNICIKLSTQM